MESELGEVLTVEWRAFMLRPVPEERTLDDFTAYTRRWARPAEAEPTATFRTWSGEHSPPSDSRPALIAGKAVLHGFGADAFERFHLDLMHAYFAENRTISDRAVILDVAACAGFDAGKLAMLLGRDTAVYDAEVVADHRAALALGISAVPSVVVNDDYLLQGAMAVEQYRKVVARLGG